MFRAIGNAIERRRAASDLPRNAGELLKELAVPPESDAKKARVRDLYMNPVTRPLFYKVHEGEKKKTPSGKKITVGGIRPIEELLRYVAVGYNLGIPNIQRIPEKNYVGEVRQNVVDRLASKDGDRRVRPSGFGIRRFHDKAGQEIGVHFGFFNGWTPRGEGRVESEGGVLTAIFAGGGRANGPGHFEHKLGGSFLGKYVRGVAARGSKGIYTSPGGVRTTCEMMSHGYVDKIVKQELPADAGRSPAAESGPKKAPIDGSSRRFYDADGNPTSKSSVCRVVNSPDLWAQHYRQDDTGIVEIKWVSPTGKDKPPRWAAERCCFLDVVAVYSSGKKK